MSTSRILHRVIIILGCAVFGASVGVCWQALRFTAKPSEFRSLAKLVAGGQVVTSNSPEWRDQRADFYGTIIETLESAEMKRRALERARALNPDLEEADVDIRVAQTKGSAIFNILASGRDPKYTRVFLDALLDEFIASRQNIRDQAHVKGLHAFLKEIVARQKAAEEALAEMERARSKVEALPIRAERERLTARLIRMRDMRDDARLQSGKLAATQESNSASAAKSGPVDDEVRSIETALQSHADADEEFRIAHGKFEGAKMAYEKWLGQAERFQKVFTESPNSVAIQERASVAREVVEAWQLPIAIGALGGGLLGAALGLLLSLIIVPPASPPERPI